ncbi:MAG: PAS domain S-box protein [Deltaproteobacteria bacterium]|nr:PAS domain S-box protein [Deltaproteobacteria bacterium]
MEDEAIVALDLKRILEDLGYVVCARTASGEKAVAQVEVDRPDLVLMDITLAGKMDGIEAAEIIRYHFDIPVVFTTAWADEEALTRVKSAYPFGYLLKPYQERDIRITIDMAFHLAQVESERKLAEEALRESEKKYKTLIETTDTGFVILDQEGRVLDANSKFVRFTGNTRLIDILNRKVTEWTAPHDLERNSLAIGQCLELGYVRHLVIDYVNQQGSFTSVEINATVVPTPEGPRIMSLSRDITERKRTENDILASENWLRSIFENFPIPYHSLDEYGRFLDVNGSLCDLLGFKREDIIGKEFGEFCTSESKPLFDERYKKVKEIRWIDNAELDLINSTGETITVLLTCRVQPHPVTNEFVRTLCIIYDITSRK